MTDPIEALRQALEGRYAVERLIGQGGMATVYLARDCRHDRPVAIKVLRPELAASIGSDRFLREIKVAAHLQHPHILALYDSGESGGFLYYVMPFVEGESLRARLDREEQLPLPEAIRLTCEVGDALQYAHTHHRIVHRDIKPENILIQGGHALVADFGIARALSQAGGDKLTETGMAVGTPHYMSPEQATGGNHIDGRSDLYSLACVFYEMLVGQPPFDGPNAMAILARHSMETVPSLQIVRHSIPDEIEEAVMRALEKTPADRFATVKEFSEALFQADLGTTARRNSHRSLNAVKRSAPHGIASPRGRSHVRTAALALGGLAILAAGGWGAWQYWHQESTVTGAAAGDLDPHRIAVLYFEDESGADSSSYLADGLTEGLIRELGQVQILDVISKGGVALYRERNAAPRDSIARALRAGTLVTGAIEQERDRLRVTARLVDGSSGAEFARASFTQPAKDLLGVQDSLAERVAGLIRERLGQEIRLREQRNRTRSVAAWALVQRAEQARKQAESLVDAKDTTGAADSQFELADSLYAQAQAADPKWVEPVVGRASVSYRRSRLVGFDGAVAKPWIDKGVMYAEQALSLDPENADALELRGTLNYWGWLLNIERNRLVAKDLLNGAQNDLEKAVKLRPTQAGAWAILSHLYNNTKGQTDAKLAGLRALEADAYLRDAPQVLNRLFIASYDLGQAGEAKHYCDEGRRRFPNDFNFTKCQLWVMSTKAVTPDVGLAWKIADSLTKLSPVNRREYDMREAQMIVAMVLARAGLQDSARRVALRARGSPEVDPNQDLAFSEVYVHILRDDKEQAFEALKRYLAANPERRASLADTTETSDNWWFRSIEDDPRFRAIVYAK